VSAFSGSVHTAGRFFNCESTEAGIFIIGWRLASLWVPRAATAGRGVQGKIMKSDFHSFRDAEWIE
jgi:hypothetical protein